jgi:hypothetical protein
MKDTDIASHFGQMLGMAQADAAHGSLIADEMTVDRRISEALAIIRGAMGDADDVSAALSSLGIPAAKRLGQAIDAIAGAAEIIRDCQSELVMLRFDASQQSTTNMMNAVLATVSVIASRDQEPTP